MSTMGYWRAFVSYPPLPPYIKRNLSLPYQNLNHCNLRLSELPTNLAIKVYLSLPLDGDVGL